MRLRGLIALLVIVQGLIVAWSVFSLPAIYALNENEMSGIVGGVQPCDPNGGTGYASPWFCNNVATFACNTECEQCENHTTHDPCVADTCWKCDGTPLITVCVKGTSESNIGCTDFGSATHTPCGKLWSINCSYDPGPPVDCYCPGEVQTSQDCPRNNCKNGHT